MSAPWPPEDLRARLEALGVDVAVVQEQFVRSQGAGGQNVNKVATCVILRYAPASVVVKAQENRTQASNRRQAWELLAARILEKQNETVRARQQEREKERRAKRARPRWLKKQLVVAKRARTVKKKRRAAPGSEADDE